MRACSRPMPRPAPVTMATRPSQSRVMRRIISSARYNGESRAVTLIDVTELHVDVLVIGAGPAGTAAAITLAHAHTSVVVIDKAEFPRDKCCGDGLTTLALRELAALGLEPAMVPSWRTVEETWLRSPSGREVCLPMP